MKALTYQQANSLAEFAIKLTEVPNPTMRNKDLLVKVMAFSVNPGDTKIRSSKSTFEGGHIILGWEFSGVVSKVGSQTEGFEIGDEVYGVGDVLRDGNYAEFVAVDYRVVAHKPISLTFYEAAAIPLTALTALGAILDTNFEPYSNVKNILIIGGAGGTGSMAIQYLKAMTDFTIIATASDEKSIAWVKELGADYVVDHFGDVQHQLSEIGLTSIDQIFSTSHTTGHMTWILNVLRPHGHLSMIESPEALCQINPSTKAISIHWQMIFTRILEEYYPEMQSKFLSQLSKLIDLGRIKTIVKTRLSGLSVETIKRAHTLIETGQNIGKIVIENIG
ncbi:NADPH2:quinone reductase [Mucilaginibacter sp. UYP25]|uniref:zinc-binding alcohol dehydrogenase family protein n=1 Tax=unclassified Mucilaginibacter TaxID=2617802 RepID=UPI003395AA6A